MPDDDAVDDDLSLEWAGVDDPATEGDDVLDLSDDEPAEAGRGDGVPMGVPWDEMAEDTTPQYEEAAFVPTSALVGDDTDDEAPPQGDPLDEAAEEFFEHTQPSARMDTLQDALSSIRERVQNLSSTMRPGEGGGGGGAGAGAGAPRTSELSLYRQATDDRTLRELQRHSAESEELL